MKRKNFVGATKEAASSRRNSRVIILLILLMLGLPGIIRAGPSEGAGVGAGKKGLPVKSGRVSVNLVDAELPVFVKFISDLTSISFIYDERLRGKVTIYSPDELTKDEAYKLFVSVLEFKGFTIISTGKTRKIIPTSTLKGDSFEVLTDKKVKRPDGAYVARVVPLEFISATGLVALIRPLVSKNAFIAPFQESNSLFILDTMLNVKRILKIVESVDIFMPRPESGINVYHLQNAKAEEIAKVLIDFDTFERGTVGIRRAGRAAGKPGSPAARSGGQAIAAQVSGEVSVVPYTPTNSLIIHASPDDYLSLVEIIKKLDKRPRQVFVEAMIMEVSITKALNVGAKWRAMSEHNNKPVVIGGVGKIDSSTISDILTGLAGLSIGGVTNFITVPILQADGTTKDVSIPGLTGLFSLEVFKDVINVLSTPHILTSDNKEAEIIVGENVPFLSQFEREASSVDQPVLQSIERHDVGITLRITPQISNDNYVKLDIYQEISAVAPTVQTGGVDAADIITTKRSARTSVVVKDGQKIVIGGLIQERKTRNVTKVPILGDIPILGYLFKFKSDKKEKTNLIVFLTPTIVDDFDDLDRLRQDREDLFSQKSEGDADSFKEDIDDEL
ncbi:MAG: secretin N-terminal domain-containing protein [Thermodesulfobacteriota bacterium]